MCIPNEELDPRCRRVRVAANLALAIGLLLWSIARPATGLTRDWFDGVVGLLMGFSIAANLMLVAKSRRSKRAV
jgi:hypothetical protein